ncbi:lipopolysaccharide transport periplasmic protein LptA [Oleispira antarctica]|uniref:Lipopolysaccharide export system protein LptA n=1 Tax=Oleispira antarctica TaxID=188908 RepID=A0A1Y5HVI4_OLEAN|nr:lipopolysaccharide transport periplasmic protein LptA [Oleispira antarctica]
MPRRNPLILSIFVSMLTSFHAYALESDASEEIIIQSNSAEFDRKAGTAIYIGDVVLDQGTLKITADRITLYSNEQKKLTKAVAIGEPAHLQQQMENEKGLTKARGKTITYRTLDKEITLLDDAILEQEGHVFTGETIVYNMLNENVSAKGGTQTELDPSGEKKPTRVKMIIQPESTETNEAAQPSPKESSTDKGSAS